MSNVDDPFEVRLGKYWVLVTFCSATTVLAPGIWCRPIKEGENLFEAWNLRREDAFLICVSTQPAWYTVAVLSCKPSNYGAWQHYTDARFV